MAAKWLQTVAETRAFSEDIDAMLRPAERDAVVAGVAAEPDGGELIPGTGGLRSGAFRCRDAANAAVRG
jgi:hypothetical protein